VWERVLKTKGDKKEELDMESNAEVKVGFGQLISEEIMQEIDKEGIPKHQVMQLLSDMEMVDENGENIWHEDEEFECSVGSFGMMDILESLPKDLISSI
jgi:hypothetical protein